MTVYDIEATKLASNEGVIAKDEVRNTFSRPNKYDIWKHWMFRSEWLTGKRRKIWHYSNRLK